MTTKQVRSKNRVVEYGEVFTAEREVKAMCNLVKQETERIDSRFLEPACGNGNFLAEILSRKLAVVRKGYSQNPYDWERNSLLALGSIYGVDLLIDNCVECRQRLFEMWDKEYKAICEEERNDDTREAAKFILSRNIICGNTLTLKCVDESGKDTDEPIVFSKWTFPFNDALMQRSDYTFAGLLAAEGAPANEGALLKRCISHYRSIHKTADTDPMKFDVIIGNPPYQLNDGGGTGSSAVPLYHHFVEKSIQLNPRYLTMIIPSRWFTGGKGLDGFRSKLLNDDRVREIHDFINAGDCFPGVLIEGGVCYFLWDRDNRGLCKVVSYANNEIVSVSERPLLEEGIDVFIRRNEVISIIKKVKSHKEKSFSQIVSTINPYGINSADFKRMKSQNGNQCYSVLGVENNKRVIKHLPYSIVQRNFDEIKRYRLFVSKADGAAGQIGYPIPARIIGKPVVAKPNMVCTETFLRVGPFSTEEEANNVRDYMQTKFFRLLVGARKNKNMNRSTYSFVPMQDFSKPWTDDELYAKYGLTQDEIDFVESMIKPMNLDDTKTSPRP